MIFIGSPRLFHTAFTPSPSDSVNTGGNHETTTDRCPAAFDPSAGRSSRSLSGCGRPGAGDHNGQPDDNQHPNVGLMVVNFGSGPEPFCTGTSIAPTRFLT